MPESRLLRRLPTILAEVVSVVFAVLVALAVDEWWEEREEMHLARETMDAIAEEIRGNRAELAPDSADAPLPQAMARLDSAIAEMRAGVGEPDVSLNWSVALLSSAAWETARITGVIRRVPLELVIDLAQLYEFQRFYVQTQDQLTSTLAGMGARMETEPVPMLLEFQSRYAIASSLRTTLSTIYACTLARLDRATPEEAAACPEGDRPPEAAGPAEDVEGRPEPEGSAVEDGPPGADGNAPARAGPASG